MEKRSVSLVCTTEDPELLTKAAEAMARTLAWLTLEGASPMMFTSQEEE